MGCYSRAAKYGQGARAAPAGTGHSQPCYKQPYKYAGVVVQLQSGDLLCRHEPVCRRWSLWGSKTWHGSCLLAAAAHSMPWQQCSASCPAHALHDVCVSLPVVSPLKGTTCAATSEPFTPEGATATQTYCCCLLLQATAALPHILPRAPGSRN
jgi:hypothetical protein